MRVISNKALVAFAAKHPVAGVPMQDWRTVVEASFFESFADLRKAFRTVDVVGKYHVFDIGGNKFRIITSIHFDKQRLYVRNVFTHKEYDQWNKLP